MKNIPAISRTPKTQIEGVELGSEPISPLSHDDEDKGEGKLAQPDLAHTIDLFRGALTGSITDNSHPPWKTTRGRNQQPPGATPEHQSEAPKRHKPFALKETQT